jgi:hypothetical protein
VLLLSSITLCADESESVPPADPPTTQNPTPPAPPGSNVLLDKPEKTDPPGPQISEAVRNMIEQARGEREKFLNRQRELQRGLPDATKEVHEQIRNQIRQNREEFLSRQNELRQEFKSMLAELKEQLKEHHQVIEQARNQENARARRGN